MTDRPEVLALIPARGGSKGVPRKNIRLLAGRPLIAYAIEAARESTLVTRVLVSTDDEEIAHVARSCGAEVPFMRPDHLAQDDSAEWAVWQHALEYTRTEGRWPAVFVCVSPTSPLRAPQDIDSAIRTLQETAADLVMTVTPSHRHPAFNMIVIDADRGARLALPPNDGILHRRQEAPPMYDVTTVAYAARPEFVRDSTSMWAGRVGAAVVPAERALDIDTEFDFKLAECLLRDRGI